MNYGVLIIKDSSSGAKKIFGSKSCESVQIEPDLEYLMIDWSIIRAHACAAGYGKNSYKRKDLGRSKGGFTTKIHSIESCEICRHQALVVVNFLVYMTNELLMIASMDHFFYNLCSLLYFRYMFFV